MWALPHRVQFVASEAFIAYLFSILLIVSAVLMLLTPFLRHAWSYGTSRVGILALAAAMVAAAVGAFLLVQASLTDPVYFIPVVVATAALQVASPSLLYLRLRERLETMRRWEVLQVGILIAFVGAAAFLALDFAGVLPSTTGVQFALLSEQALMALGAASLFVRFALRFRPHDTWGPWSVWLAAVLFAVAFTIVVPYALVEFAPVYFTSGIAGWLIATAVTWRDR